MNEYQVPIYKRGVECCAALCRLHRPTGDRGITEFTERMLLNLSANFTPKYLASNLAQRGAGISIIYTQVTWHSQWLYSRISVSKVRIA